MQRKSKIYTKKEPSLVLPREALPFWTFVTGDLYGVKPVGINDASQKVHLTPAQSAIWKSYDRRVALTSDEAAAYKLMTGREPWVEGSRAPGYSLYALSRGAGKSMLSGCIALYESIVSGYVPWTAGEDVAVIVIAPRVSQAKRILAYIEGLQDRPLIDEFIDSIVDGEVRLKNGRRIIVSAADQEATAARGPTCLALIIDECAFLPPSQDAEIFEAATGSGRGVKTFRAVLCSSVNGQAGLFWEKFKDYHKVDNELWEIFHGPADVVYPSVLDDPDAMRKKIEALPAYKREYLCDFSVGSEAEKVFTDDELSSAVRPGSFESPVERGAEYVAAVDTSSLVRDGDAFVLTVMKRCDNGEMRQVCLRAWHPSDGLVTVKDAAKECTQALSEYGIAEVNGDSYAKNWVSETFLSYGISYVSHTTGVPQKLARASLLKELMATSSIQLLDNSRQTQELRDYEKTTLPSGKIVVNKAPSGSDDYVDALGLAVEVMAAGQQILHPPKALVAYSDKDYAELFAGSRYPQVIGRGPVLSFDEIASNGEGARWMLQNWSSNWRTAMLSIGEMSHVCGVGPVPLINYLGRDVILQHAWMRWVLGYWCAERGRMDWVLEQPIQFPVIRAWEEIKRQLIAKGVNKVVTFKCLGAENQLASDLPSDWQPSKVKSYDSGTGMARHPCRPPWASPPEDTGLEQLISEAHQGYWPPRHWAKAVESEFSRGRRIKRERDERLQQLSRPTVPERNHLVDTVGRVW